jgi:hypothetical protein
MTFNQLERALVVGCSAVFLLTTADGMGMTWICPASGPGICSERVGTTDQGAGPAAGITRGPRWALNDIAGSLDLCRWNERATDEQFTGSVAAARPPSPSERGIPCPVEREGHVAKMTSRLGVPPEGAGNDP